MATVTELGEQITQAYNGLVTLEEQFKGKMYDDAATAKSKEYMTIIDNSNAEIGMLTTREEALRKYGTIATPFADRKAANITHPGNDPEKTPGKSDIPAAFVKAFGDAKSMGDFLIRSPQFKAILDLAGVRPGELGSVLSGVKLTMQPATLAAEGISVKALLTSDAASAGTLFRAQRLPQILELLREPLKVTDLLPTVPVTGTNSVEYVKEVAFTNAAAVVPEATSTTDDAALKPQSALTFTVVTDTLEQIAHWIPATRQILADAPQLRALVDNRLRIGLLEKLEQNVVADILAASGLLVQAVGADTKLDAMYKAAQKVRVTGHAVPEAYVIHPNDWTDIRLAKNLNGDYLMGAPSVAGAVTCWSLPVIDTQWITENTGLVADFSMLGALYEREQIQTYITDSHSDFFVRNLIAILMELRAIVAIYRATAGCKITGL